MKGTQANDRRFPLPRRTGHEDFPHPALARVVFSGKHSQRDEAQMLEMSREGDTFASAPASLTASLKVLP